MLERLGRVLSEPVMGFLALAALVLGMTPELFPVTRAQHNLLTAGEWLVILLFAVEYLVHLALAEDKRAYMLNPWRLLDLAIIVAPFVSLVPGSPELLRSSPFLRVLRLVRALVAGRRASERLLRSAALTTRQRLPEGPPVVTRLDPDSAQAATLRWEDLLAWLEAPQGWLHAANLDSARLDELARATRVPRSLLEQALGESSFPRLEPGVKWAALALPLPREQGGRESVLLLVAPQAVLSLTLYRSELQTTARPLPGTPQSWPLRVVFGVLRLVLARHEEIAGLTEREVRMLEELPADESPGNFFERTFALRKRISMSKADLWRLRGVLRAVATGRRPLPGGEGGEREEAERIAEEADVLHETADGLREQLLSLLDLHLNVSGYGMNRFMRLLAIVSALGLVPAVVGGLLGMNLVTNPWPATLAQVSFGVFVIMLCMLYTFLAKGWLK